MKIRCDNCATVFMIDDALISDKGVKAQCPKCGHQKVVWKHNAIQETSWIDAPEGSSASLGGGASNWMDEPLSGVLQEKLASMDGGGAAPLLGGGAPLFPGDDSRGGSLLPGGPSSSLYPLSSASSDSLYPAGEQEPLGGGLYSPGGKGSNSLYPGSPSQDLLPPLGLEYEDSLANRSGFDASASMVYTPHGEPESLSLDDDAGDSLALHLPPPSTIAKQTEDAWRSASDVDAPPVDPEWIKVRRSSDKKEIGPMTLQEVRSLYAHGKISLLDECAGRDGQWRLIKAVPEIESILSRTPQITEKSPENKGATRASKSTGGGGSMIWVVLSLLLLGGGAGAAYFLRPYLKSNKTDGTDGPLTDRGAGLLESKIERWKKSYPGLKTSPRESKKIAEKAMSLFRRDLPGSYRAAREVFHQSLVAWDKNADAVAALALSVLWENQGAKTRQGRTIEEFEEILREFTKKIPSNQSIQAALAAYVARQGEIEKAIKRVQAAAKKAPKDPLVLLVAGELMIQQERTTLEARAVLERVVESQPEMLRARYFLAQLQMKTANYFQAAKNLEPLTQKKHLAGLFLMAELQSNLGNYREAKQILSRLLTLAPQHDEARLFLGVLEYQGSRNFSAAKRTFARLNQSSSKRGILRRVLLHLAYIALEENKPKKGLELVGQLEKLDKHYLPLLFAKAQLLLVRRKYALARKNLLRLTSQVSDPPQQLLLGYLHSQLKEKEKANQVFLQIASESQRFIWSHLFLAAASLEAGNNTQAFVYIKNSLDIEPSLYGSSFRVGPYFLSRRIFRGLVDIFRTARTEDNSITLAAAGMVNYQLGDINEASSYLKRARARDANALAANLYLAQIAYDRKQYASAQRYARRVYATYNQHPVAGTLLGLCEFYKGNEKRALGYFAQVEESRPWYLYTRAHRLMILHKKGEKNEAQELAKSLLTSYRYNKDFLRVLYSIEW